VTFVVHYSINKELALYKSLEYTMSSDYEPITKYGKIHKSKNQGCGFK